MTNEDGTTLREPDGTAESSFGSVSLGNGQMGILEVLILLVARKRLLGAMIALGGIAGATLSLLLPHMYTATAVIMPPQQAHSTAASLLGQLGSLAGVGGADLSLKTPSELYIGILGSRTISEAIIDRFHLRQIYRTQRRSDTIKKLANRTSFSSGKDTLIRIAVDDVDAARSAAIANAYIDELYRQTSRLAITESAQRRLFFQTQLDQERLALTKAESEMKDTQEQTGLFAAPSQAELLLRSTAELQADIASREVALEALRSGATNQNPEVQRGQAELASLRAHLKSLQENAESKSSQKVTAGSQFPGAELQHMRRLRELRYHESMFELLAKQFEAARIDEAKEAPVLQIVDTAAPPDKRSGLSIPLAAGMGAAALAFFTALYLFVAAAVASPERAETAALLGRLLWPARAAVARNGSRS